MSQKVRQLVVQLRSSADGPEGVVEGYITTWDNEYPVGRGMNEVIRRGAFDDTKASVPVYLEHDWKAGPIGHMAVTSDDVGLRAVATLYIDTDPRAMSVFRSLEAGALAEWSVGFMPDDVVRERSDLEVITRGNLREASVVNMGANPNTKTLAVRASEDAPAEAPADEAEEASLVEQVRALLVRLLAGEAAELAEGGQARGAIQALLDVLSAVDWYERIDDAEDDASEPGTEMDMAYMCSQIEKPWVRNVLRELI